VCGGERASLLRNPVKEIRKTEVSDRNKTGGRAGRNGNSPLAGKKAGGETELPQQKKSTPSGMEGKKNYEKKVASYGVPRQQKKGAFP